MTLRPGWLADDQQWRDQLSALDPSDVEWIAKQWALADGPDPAVDMSWVTLTWAHR
jgi:hypothetical protein